MQLDPAYWPSPSAQGLTLTEHLGHIGGRLMLEGRRLRALGLDADGRPARGPAYRLVNAQASAVELAGLVVRSLGVAPSPQEGALQLPLFAPDALQERVALSPALQHPTADDTSTGLDLTLGDALDEASERLMLEGQRLRALCLDADGRPLYGPAYRLVNAQASAVELAGLAVRSLGRPPTSRERALRQPLFAREVLATPLTLVGHVWIPTAASSAAEPS